MVTLGFHKNMGKKTFIVEEKEKITYAVDETNAVNT